MSKINQNFIRFFDIIYIVIINFDKQVSRLSFAANTRATRGNGTGVAEASAAGPPVKWIRGRLAES
jgi:hypothetical protein